MLRNRGSQASNTFGAYGEDLAVARSSEHLWDLVERPSRDLSLRSPVYLTDCSMGRAGYAMRFWWALHRSKWCAGVQGCQPLCGYIIQKSVWMVLSFDKVIIWEEAYSIAQLKHMYSLMYIENSSVLLMLLPSGNKVLPQSIAAKHGLWDFDNPWRHQTAAAESAGVLSETKREFQASNPADVLGTGLSPTAAVSFHKVQPLEWNAIIDFFGQPATRISPRST